MSFDFDTIIPFLTSPEIQEKLFSVKIGFLALSALFLGTIIFVLLRTHYLQWLFLQDFWEFFTFRPFGAKRITRLWNKILKRLDTGLESEYKLAIIEADDLLESSLKRMGYAGKNLEERLEKLTSATLPNIDDIYRAHKIRNTIVHDPDYKFNLDDVRTTIEIYEKAFNALQILT